jgi:YVTN family beta-propeller protein
MRRPLLLAAAVVLVPIAAAVFGAHAQAMRPAADVTLWITLGDIDEIVEADAYTFKEIRHIKTDPKPHGLAVSPDGSKIYLASDKTGDLQVFDARKGVAEGRIHVGNDPNQITLTKDGRFAYVPLRADDQIAVVQLDPLKIVKKLPVAKGPHDAYTSDDGTRIYVGAQFGNGIIAIDPAAQSVLYTIPTADGVRPLEISPDGKTVYAALSHLIGFVVADTATRKVTRTVELAKLAEGVPEPYLATYTHSLILSPDAKELWVTDCANDLVRIVRLADMKEVTQIRVGKFPHWFTMRPDNKVMFVSLWDSDAVAAIDVQTRKVLANMQFARGTGPKRITVAKKP